MTDAKQGLLWAGISFAMWAGALGSATATENYDLRYAPGIGGADMSAPLDPGLYFQVPAYSYRGSIESSQTVTLGASDIYTGAIAGLAVPFAATKASTPISSKVTVSVRGLLPRVTFMSTHQVLGATLGVTALLPIIEKRAEASATTGATTVTGVSNTALSFATGGAVTLPALTAGINTKVAASAQSAADGASSRKFGIGDLEVAPVLRWNRDPDQILFVPTVILPTGFYTKERTANPGAGKFYTFRPSVQYSRIGEGWDVGSRVSFSMNTKNSDTNYRSGNYLNIDLQVMKSLSDAWRVGLAGYGVMQTTKDTVDGTPTTTQAETVGKKGHVYALGPAFAWIKGAGELLIDGRLMKEFSAEDRPEGTSFWINVALPLQ